MESQKSFSIYINSSCAAATAAVWSDNGGGEWGWEICAPSQGRKITFSSFSSSSYRHIHMKFSLTPIPPSTSLPLSLSFVCSFYPHASSLYIYPGSFCFCCSLSGAWVYIFECHSCLCCCSWSSVLGILSAYYIRKSIKIYGNVGNIIQFSVFMAHFYPHSFFPFSLSLTHSAFTCLYTFFAASCLFVATRL